jgi:hypothetical protein
MGCPCHKTSAAVSGVPKVDRTDWIEVECQQEVKLVVPEWTTIQVHVGQKVKLPPKYIEDHAEWFILPGKSSPGKGKGYYKAILDLKSPKEA